MRAPRLARLWIRLVAPAALRDSLLADLDELAAQDPEAPGWRVWLRYWLETLRGTPHLLGLRLEAVRHAGRDVRHAFRGLRHQKLFALTAILTLAGGIGITTTIFSIVDAELWRPLPFAQPERLVKVFTQAGDRGPVTLLSGADLVDWRAGSQALLQIAGDGIFSRQTLQLETAQAVLVSLVTANYFDVLPRPVVAGRTFVDTDRRVARAAVLTDRAWRRIFDAAPDTVGRSVLLDGRSTSIVGIVRASDSMGMDADVFLALDETTPAFLDRRQPLFTGVVGRLHPGVDPGVVRTQLDAVQRHIAAALGGSTPARAIRIEALSDFYRTSNARPLYFLLGASVVVLLLGTVNVAALILGRAFSRTREFALRGALGGGQIALARQLLVEGAMIALPAGALGVLVATWAVGAIGARLPADVLQRGADIPVDWRAAGFAFGVSVLTALLVGLAPLAATRRQNLNLSAVLGAAGRAGRSRSEGRARVALLTVQLALTTVLIAGAAVFVKSFVALTHVPLGFEPANLVALRAPLGGPRYATDAQIRDYAGRLLAAARATPGVQTAALSSSSPLGSGPLVFFADRDRPRPVEGAEPRAILRAATPGYFLATGIPIRRGREFTASDVAGAPRVAIVNEHLAGELAGGGDPVGRSIELLPGARAAWTRRPGALTIIGVAGNVKEVSLNEVSFSGIYVPLDQMPPASLEIIARTSVPPAAVSGSLRQAAAAVDPAVPVSAITTFDDRVDRALHRDRFNLELVATFAAIGVLLASLGIYGTVAYAVQTRTRELGVRMALGARPAGLMSSAVWQACRVGLAGGAAGILATLALARAIGDALYLVPGAHLGMLYGVTITDPFMLALAFAGITVVAALAALAPARRIARLDPVRVLRNE
jgi:predicted permease